MKFKKLVAVVLGVVVSGAAWATPGGVDAAGCHGSKKIGWHCHPQKLGGGGFAGGESAAQRSKRLDKECRGGVDAGMCSGHVKKGR